MGLAGLSMTQSLADLEVELHEAAAGLRQIPARAYHRQAAGLPQRLVTEVDVQEGLDRIICLVAKDVVGPQRPEQTKVWCYYKHRFSLHRQLCQNSV